MVGSVDVVVGNVDVVFGSVVVVVGSVALGVVVGLDEIGAVTPGPTWNDFGSEFTEPPAWTSTKATTPADATANVPNQTRSTGARTPRCVVIVTRGAMRRSHRLKGCIAIVSREVGPSARHADLSPLPAPIRVPMHLRGTR